MRFAFVTLLAVALGCSFLVEFDESQRPCSPEGECLADYLCRGRVCVKKGSVALGETCSGDAHCDSGLVCAGFVCRRPCGRPFLEDGGCATGEICALMGAVGTVRAACVDPKNQCTDECARAGTCVLVGEHGVCYPSCTPKCMVASPCTDQCDTKETGAICQPAGTGHLFSCLPEGLELHGRSCDYLTAGCAAGHGCVRPAGEIEGKCVRYCAGDKDCAGLKDPWADSEKDATCVVADGVGICGTGLQ